MNRLKFSVLGVCAVLLFLLAVSAFSFPKELPLPDKAKENSKAFNSPYIDNDFVLNPPGLEKKVFIHYAKPACNKNGICEPELGENPSCKDCKTTDPEPTPDPEPDSSCYEFMGSGVYWKELPQDLVIDPDNGFGLSQAFIVDAVMAGASEWDSFTGLNLFSGYSIDHSASWDGQVRDGRNEILFGDYPEEGVIGVTVTWGYFKGKPSSRRIVEFDILFDNDFEWGDATLNSGLMDLENIATHELGHGIGMSDLYDTTCIDQTMYGYSGEGDIEKRTLAAGDITGIRELYGS